MCIISVHVLPKLVHLDPTRVAKKGITVVRGIYRYNFTHPKYILPSLRIH